MLTQLVYYSEVRDLGPGGIQRILEQSRTWNSEHGLTGSLLFNQQYFLQCLEGGREEVTATFSRVAADPRHAHVNLMCVHDIDERSFPGWTMGYASSTSALKESLFRFQPTVDFNPETLSSNSAIALLTYLRHVDHTV